MKLKSFQDEAIQQVLSLIPKKKTIRFQSPTGSGKTFMTANIVKNINQSLWGFRHPNKTYLYIAPSTGQLDFQGCSKITSYLNNNFLNGYKTNYINGNLNFDYLERNTINFIGWSMIKKGSSILRENSERKTLYDIIDETHNKGIEIILLVDEAHREYNANKSVDFQVRKDFINSLNSLKIIEMSATLDGEVDVIVTSQQVKESGIIRQSAIVNETTHLGEKNFTKGLIESGIEKIESIKKSVIKTNMPDLNPLLLIQIPDGSPKIDGKNINDYYINLINEVFGKHNWKEGFDFAIWLDKNKTTKNKEEITKNNSQYKAVVFKQALATGWDVPRAQVLVKLRNPKSGSKSFEIQTIGRILRNPFLKIFKKYKPFNEEDVVNLNNAFVYTNDQDWIQKGISSDYSGFLILEKSKYELSDRAINNPIKINKIGANFNGTSFDFIDELFSINKHKNFFKILHAEILSYKPMNKNISEQIIESEDILENKIINNGLSNIQLSTGKDPLFFIYISFLQVIKNNKHILYLLNLFSKKYNLPKKKVYRYIIDNYIKRVKSSKDEKPLYIDQYLMSSIYQVLSKKTIYKVTEEFELSHSIDYNSNTTGFHHNGNGNSYKVWFDCSEKSGAFDSKIESKFYKNFIHNVSSLEDVHIFRNKTNPINSFFVEYFNSFENRISAFYPDFIVSTKYKILIIEAKGLGKNDIDKNTEAKFQSLFKNINNIKSNKEVIIFKVGMQAGKSNIIFEEYNEAGFKAEHSINEFFQLLASIDKVIDSYEKDK